jgi:hypothetical protein
MQAVLFDDVVEIAFGGIIPADQLEAFAFAVLYGLIAELGIGYQPKFVYMPFYPAVVIQDAAHVFTASLYVKSHFGI